MPFYGLRISIAESEKNMSRSARSKSYVRFGEKLLTLQNRGKAAECFQKAIENDPENIFAVRHLAKLLQRQNRVVPAKQLVFKGLESAPKDIFLNLIAAKLERREGRFQKAITRLELLIDSDLGEIEQKYHFELGKLYDLKADAKQAFSHFESGNRYASQTAKEKGLDKQRFNLDLYDQIRMMENSSFFQQTQKTAVDSPIFIIGFPRSGTTLLDLILDSHPGASGS